METRPSWKYLVDPPEEKPARERAVNAARWVGGIAALVLVGSLPFFTATATRYIAASTVPDERDDQTILRAVVDYDTPMTVYVNGEKVPTASDGTYSRWRDVSRYVRPGENVVRVEGKDLPLVRVHVSHAETRGKFARVGEFTGFPDAAPPASAPVTPYEFRFRLPGAAVAKGEKSEVRSP
jgi:hypothetical protein